MNGQTQGACRFTDEPTIALLSEFSSARDLLNDARRRYDILRVQVEALMDKFNTDAIETDSLRVLRTKRTTISIDRKTLQALHEDVYREVAVLGNSNVISISTIR